MKYAILHTGQDLNRDRIESELTAELTVRGYTPATLADDIKFILNFTRFDDPPAVRRKSQHEFVVSIAVLSEEADDLRYLCYNTLIQTLSNLVICIQKRTGNAPEVYCITPEVGFYHFRYSPQRLLEAMKPVIGAHFVIDNRIRYDLPEKYSATPFAQKLRQYGAALDTMGVLPTPFPLAEVLSPENIDHLYDLFNIKGLSYGNLSVRERIPEVGPNTFWMTARGADKAHLKGIGQDILLVEGYDVAAGEILVRLPPGSNPGIRVSVDAIEHVMIYEAFPEVGAIVHVHAWMDGVPCTQQNYPCGTGELAREVMELLKSTRRPGRAVVGLKNHGLTITGPDLEDIFSRIEGKLLKEVPMME